VCFLFCFIISNFVPNHLDRLNHQYFSQASCRRGAKYCPTNQLFISFWRIASFHVIYPNQPLLTNVSFVSFQKKKTNTIFRFLSSHSFHLFLSTRNKKLRMVPFVVFTVDDQAGGVVRTAAPSSVSSPNILRGRWLRSAEPRSRTDPCCCVTW
jgi:hypothetical protein